jgi:hypothetical protein
MTDGENTLERHDGIKKKYMDLELILETAKDCLALKPDGIDGNPDGYDGAIIGITDNGQLVYSKELMVEILMKTDGVMGEEEAWEFLEFNCFCAYVGEQTPIFINTY